MVDVGSAKGGFVTNDMFDRFMFRRVALDPMKLLLWALNPASVPTTYVENEQETPPMSRWQRLIEAKIRIPLTSGNEVIPLRNGDQIFPAMIAATDDAETAVDFLTFVDWTGDIARRLAEALERAARRGVRVRVVLDR